MKFHFPKFSFNVLFVFILLASLLGSATPAQAAQRDAALPVERLLKADGRLDLSTGYSGELDITNFDVSLDPALGPTFKPLASPNVWNALGSGLNNKVYAIAVSGTDVYVGGIFTDAGGDANADYIAKFSGGVWSALGATPLNSSVSAIAVSGADVYAGGDFTDAGGDVNADYIAKFSGGAWSALGGTPLNNTVYAIAVSGADVYAGGGFLNAGGDANADFIAKFSGGVWSALGATPLNNTVSTIAISGTDVYAGGAFTAAGGIANADSIAKFSGGVWSALGGTPLNNSVNAIAISGADVYAGGDFINAGGDANADRIAKFSGGAWSALGGTPLNSPVYAIAISGADVYAGGLFTDAGGDANADRIAKFSGGAWSALGGTPLNNFAFAIAISGADVYAGGLFTDAGGDTNADYVARFETPSATITVNTAADENGTGAGCSLREAITAANTNAAYGGCPAGAGSDTITFAGNYTITLVGSQLPTVTTVITITGNGATNTIIQASTCNPVTLPGGCTAAAYLVFDVSGGNLTLNGLTVRHGQGGIYNTAGMLRLTGVSVEANSASFGAGIVNSFGTVILHESLLANNVAASFGGAVANSSGTLHVVNSTISGNAANGTGASDGGGAIDSYGSAPVMTFYNSTVTNNSAVAPNTAKSGIWREAGTSFFVNSIIANNNGANNCFRSGGSGTTIAGSNIENGDTCGLGGQNADPMLIPLAENGGLTQTHALLPGSPAINLGDTSWAVAEDDTTPLTTDQRGAGYPRIRGASVDMGAYESACIGGPYSVPAGDAPALIEAITCANATPTNDVINLTNSTYTLTLQSAIEIGLPYIVTAATGGTLTINGNGATIQRSSAVGTPNFKFFEVATGANLTIDRVTLANGHAQVGGAIFSNGTLTITNSTIRDNYALRGGALTVNVGAVTTVSNSLIASNRGENFGGAIEMYGGTMYLINSTLSGNQILGSDPGNGGGAIDAYNTPTLNIVNSTIGNNTAPQAALSGIWLENGTLTIANSIVANNNGANNCVITGTLTDNGGNLDNGTTCGFGGLVGQNTNPLLGTLANNGGPTQTMALLSGSPAINAGDDADCEATDQRGVARPQGSHCDIGAYEANGGGDTTGVFRPGNGLLYLKNANTTGFADVAINYGTGGDYPIAGDWNGDGTATIGIYRNGSFYLRNSNTLGFADIVFAFGTPGDQPVAGDWNGDGVDTIGVYSNGQFLLRNSNSAGAANMSFFLGNPGDIGIAGDWNGDGSDTTGVFRPSNGIIFLKNANTTGFADIALNYGLSGDMPVTGDWNNDGIDTIGVYRNAQFLLRNSNTIGFAEIVFGLGNPGDMPISGNWDGIP